MTELEVLKVLSREIIRQKNDGEVTFQGVMDQAAPKLGTWASDPSFVDFFNFILNLGADGGPHIKGLINFVETRVNSSKRALRLGAFAQVGELNTALPRVKVALIMRAYRLPPKKAIVGAPGWCPEPETTWKKASLEPQLRLMEDILHKHNVTLRKNIVDLLGGCESDGTSPKNAIAVEELMMNVSIQCACTMSIVSKMTQPTAAKTREALMLGCKAAYKASLGDESVTKLMQFAKALPGTEWFDFATLPEDTKAAVAAQDKDKEGAAESKPRVITFNPETGAPENEQATVEKETKKGEWMPLPMCEWLTGPTTRTMGKKESYMGAVVQALREKHMGACECADTHMETDTADSLLVAIMQHTTSNQLKVITRAAVAARKLELWPCVPKANKVYETSVHPDKVLVQVWQKNAEEQDKSSFYLNPEATFPEGYTAFDVQRSEPTQRAWKWTGKETMHPYWCVTKLTDDDLVKRNVGAKEETPKLRFNLTTSRRKINMVKCGRVFTISIPVMTNAVDLEEGEALVMEVQKKAKKEKAPEDWRTQQRKRQKKEEQGKIEHKAAFDSAGKQPI